MVIYKRARRFELGTTENKSSKWPERDSNPGTAGLRVQRADHSATLPPYFFSLNNAKLVVFAQNIQKKKVNIFLGILFI